MTNWSYLVARQSLWDVCGGDSSFMPQWSYCLTAGRKQVVVTLGYDALFLLDVYVGTIKCIMIENFGAVT